MSKLKKAFLDPDTDPSGEEGSENPQASPLPEGLRIIRAMGVPPRSRVAGVSKYDLAGLQVGDALVSTEAKHIRNATVAARAYSKRIGADGGVAPKFVSRKTPAGEYALIRES